MLQINLTEQEFRIVIEGLSELPAKKVFNLILKLDQERSNSIAQKLTKTEKSIKEETKEVKN